MFKYNIGDTVLYKGRKNIYDQIIIKIINKF